jgi:hypothetical protein
MGETVSHLGASPCSRVRVSWSLVLGGWKRTYQPQTTLWGVLSHRSPAVPLIAPTIGDRDTRCFYKSLFLWSWR